MRNALVRGLLCLILVGGGISSAGAGAVEVGERWMLATQADPELDIANIEQAEVDWQPSSWRAPNLGFESGVVWLRLDIQPNELEPGRWRLWIRNSLLAEIHFFALENGVLQSTQRDGLKLRRDERTGASRHPAFTLQVQPEKSYRLYLRVQSDTALQVPAELFPEKEFIAAREANDLALGVFVGVLLAMMLYNLALYFSVGDRGFLLYVGHVAALLLFVASWQGLGAAFLWPDLIGPQTYGIAIATFLVIGFSTWFCMGFLELNAQNFPLIDLFVGVRNLAFVGVVLTPLLPVQWTVVGSSVLSFIAVVMVATAIVQRASLRQRPTRLFAIGWALYVTGAFVMGLNKFGFIEVTSASENLLLWASVLDMALVCIALGDRFHSSRNRRIEQQAHAIEGVSQELEDLQGRILRECTTRDALEQAVAGQEEYARQLEQRLRDRGRELALVQRNLQQASEADGLTGLKNRRHFSGCLLDESQRSNRLGSGFSLLLIDVDRFRDVNDSFGHQVGDECLRQLGELLQQQLKRPTDLLCRFGGEQFAALLPDTPQEGALQLAEKMRQRVAGCPLLCGGQRVMITVSVGVTGPQHNGDSKSAKPELLLGRAGQALQRAKTEGRNCVVLAI